MSLYTKNICRWTDCTEREALCVESYMRLRFRVLDGLSHPEFVEEANAALACVRQDPQQAESLAKTYGLLK
jgi:hypothetical protein